MLSGPAGSLPCHRISAINQKAVRKTAFCLAPCVRATELPPEYVHTPSLVPVLLTATGDVCVCDGDDDGDDGEDDVNQSFPP